MKIQNTSMSNRQVKKPIAKSSKFCLKENCYYMWNHLPKGQSIPSFSLVTASLKHTVCHTTRLWSSSFLPHTPKKMLVSSRHPVSLAQGRPSPSTSGTPSRKPHLISAHTSTLAFHYLQHHRPSLAIIVALQHLITSLPIYIATIIS